MNLIISKTPEEAGRLAAQKASSLLSGAVQRQGYARMIVSTGQSQFEFFEALVKMDIPWDKVELFHLDEYIGIPITHKASFRKYLKERFMDKINGGVMNYISGEGDYEAEIAAISSKINKKPVDIGVIGIGENGHIAFNDPPADFDTKAAFKAVTLDLKCRRQQVGEGWFPTIEDVPEMAISATVHQILSCKTILSVVPHKAKAAAVRDTVNAKDVTNMIPATALTKHGDWHLYLDEASAGLLPK